MTSNDKVWNKVLREAEKGAYTHIFYVWEQLEHITKKIILAKGNVEPIRDISSLRKYFEQLNRTLPNQINTTRIEFVAKYQNSVTEFTFKY